MHLRLAMRHCDAGRDPISRDAISMDQERGYRTAEGIVGPLTVR